jgi:hypothetical protein
VLEGTLAANQVTSRITDNYGAGIDFPLFTDDIMLGAETRYDNTDENITSIKSNTQLVYTQLRLLRSTSLYLSRRHTVTEYRGGVNVDNDVDKTTYHALLKIQPSHRTSLSLVYDDSEDVGSSRLRSYTDSSIRFEWNYRRILVNLTGSLLKEKQGSQIRNRSAIHLNMIRTF